MPEAVIGEHHCLPEAGVDFASSVDRCQGEQGKGLEGDELEVRITKGLERGPSELLLAWLTGPSREPSFSAQGILLKVLKILLTEESLAQFFIEEIRRTVCSALTYPSFESGERRRSRRR